MVLDLLYGSCLVVGFGSNGAWPRHMVSVRPLFLARWESKRTHGPMLLIFGCIWLAVLMLGLSWVAATSYGPLGSFGTAR